MTVYITVWGTTRNQTPVRQMLYTMINMMLLARLRSCWETRPDSAMPSQAVSPWAVDTGPTDQIKKTQLRRSDTGSFSTQLSRPTHTTVRTDAHTPPASLFSFSPPSHWHTPQIGRQDCCQLSSHCFAARPDYSASSRLLTRCTNPLSL